MHKLFPLQALSHSNHSPSDKDTDCLGVKQQAGLERRSSLWGWPCAPSSLDTREAGKEHRSRVPTQRLSLWKESLKGHADPQHWTMGVAATATPRVCFVAGGDTHIDGQQRFTL